MKNFEYKIGPTTWLIIATGLIWLVYDVYAYVTNDVQTISRIITEFSYYTPIAPFIFGLLAGHFFWGPKVKEFK